MSIYTGNLGLCRNDLVFEKKKLIYSPLIAGSFFGNPLASTWIILQKPFAQALVLKASQQVDIAFFSRAHG
jgi:hypothetical protein